ncbi:MAG: acyl-CoA dehydrogenase family protein [Deltaproteobacteria bacterium]|nr:acyl-CoA dehydrogenase family protein [Deltaproteobacteria bacterium]MBW2361047.1 acyl-CoA dehydrogenase family protein [Deltaproteobacteria bacterium]
MDLKDSPHEAAFRAEARAFLEGHAPAEPMPQYHKEFVGDEGLVERHREWQQKLHAHGWGALTWPKEYGGRGLGPIEQIIWNQELARAGLGLSLYMVGIGMAGPTLIAHGSDVQKQRHLEPILRAEQGICQLFSEPGAGSDLASLATRALRDGDEWVVSGQKTWCSGATWADYGILLARTDPAAPKRKGISFFLVDMKTPGIEVRPLRQMTGDAHFNEVFLTEVRIPDSNRIGPEGAGWPVAQTTLMNERMAMAGADGLFVWEELREHARENLGRIDGATRDELAKLYAWTRTLEMLNARVITKLGRGEMPAAESSVMKLAMVRTVSLGSELGLHMLGPEGLLRTGTWQQQWLFSPAFHLAGGSDEVQKNLAAERVLGLPPEPGAVASDTPFEDLPRS